MKLTILNTEDYTVILDLESAEVLTISKDVIIKKSVLKYTCHAGCILNVIEKHIRFVQKELPLEFILSKVCKSMNVDIKDVKSKSKKTMLVQARAIFSLVSAFTTHKSYEEIGKIINRDHSSIVHYINKLIFWHKISDKAKEMLSELGVSENLVDSRIDILKNKEKWK